MSSKKLSWALLGILLVSGIFYILPNFSGKKKTLLFKDIVADFIKDEKVVLGNPYNFTLNKDGLSAQDSVVIYLDGDRNQKVDGSYEIAVQTTDIPLGYHKVKITAFHGDKEKTVELVFYVVSDIQPELISHTITQTINRDIESYTQGLEIYNGILYESGGQFGQSLIRKVDPKSAKVLKKVNVASEYFGEGLTIFNDKVYQLTWQNGICLVYDLELNLLNKINFKTPNGEGWGLCHDNTNLILSDGSNRLHYVNPETFEIEKTIYVYAGDKDVQLLNELEYLDGYIYANVYTTNQIVKIEATTGKVVSVANLDNLDKANPKADVFNGIAWNKATKDFIVTGKYWGKLYHIKM